MKNVLMFSIVILLQACNNNKQEIELKYIGKFGYNVVNSVAIYEIDIANCSETDCVKYGVLAERILNDLEADKDASFYFRTITGKIDSLKFDRTEIKNIQHDFDTKPCLLKSCEHIIKNMSNEKIMFYDKILFDIMKYESKINNIDTAYYAKDDVSIVSIVRNLCLYSPDNPGDKYKKQSKYLKVLHIWCENRGNYPMYDKSDFIIR